MPHDLVRGSFVEQVTEWRLVLPHLASDVASAAKNFTLASGSSGFTRPVGCTCTHSKSTLLAPTASPILIASPVQCSPFVVGKCNKSGRYFARRESLPKSAPKPPLQRITGPYSL